MFGHHMLTVNGLCICKKRGQMTAAATAGITTATFWRSIDAAAIITATATADAIAIGCGACILCSLSESAIGGLRTACTTAI